MDLARKYNVSSEEADAYLLLLFTPTNHLNVLRVFFSAVWPSKIQVCVSEIIDPTLELRLRVEGHVAPGLASDGVSSS